MLDRRIEDLDITNFDADDGLHLYESLARLHLKDFVRGAWMIVEPSRRYHTNWHIEAICEHLEAVTMGQIRKLIINIPPRHMKSLLVCVFWPVWVWLKSPEARWIFSSYADNLSKRDSLKCRNILDSAFYNTVFKPQWSLKDDQNEKMRFENSATGYRIATSVGGAGTGDGGDYLVVDDPHKATDIYSEVKRQAVITWWRDVMSSRGNDPKTVRKVVVMQRLHEKDLSGELLSDGDWDHLMIPARYEPRRSVITSIGWKDPRQEENQILWPTRMPEKELDALAKEMTPLTAPGQLQQNPQPANGGLFKRHWWQRYKKSEFLLDKADLIIQFWDTAQKAGISNDCSVCATWAKTKTGFYLLDLWRGKVEAPQLKSTCIDLYAKMEPHAVVIEDKSSGSSLIQQLRQETTIPVIPYNPGQNDKEVRAVAAVPMVEAKNCYLPEGEPWVEDFISEHERFPLSEYMDQVDTTSMMREYFAKIESIQPRVRSL